MTPEQQIAAALEVLKPPPSERETWRKRIEEYLGLLTFLTANDDEDEQEVGTKRGQKQLTRYIDALSRARAARVALNPYMQQFLLVETSLIDDDIVEAKAMQTHYPLRRKGRPANKAAMVAVELAAFLLDERGCELTMERGGKWHRLAKVFANTRGDLRDYLYEFHARRQTQPDAGRREMGNK
jgi:hypothetical protein